MTTLSIYDKVSRLVEFATGESYGDGYTVTDVISGYAEPGYGSNDTVVVLGDWNDKTRYVDGEREVLSTMPSRLARSLERVGAEIEWHDEWTQCQNCYRAVRTQSDSYSWKPYYVWVEDSGPICADCLVQDGEDAITGFGNEHDSYVNDATKCITWCEPSHVESFGFVKWEPGNEHTYENGWHPGQTDDPSTILAAILEVHETAEVVFFLDESSQFYIRFSAYFRIPETDDENGDE
jgi:hypothetical protein